MFEPSTGKYTFESGEYLPKKARCCSSGKRDSFFLSFVSFECDAAGPPQLDDPQEHVGSREGHVLGHQPDISNVGEGTARLRYRSGRGKTPSGCVCSRPAELCADGPCRHSLRYKFQIVLRCAREHRLLAGDQCQPTLRKPTTSKGQRTC